MRFHFPMAQQVINIDARDDEHAKTLLREFFLEAAPQGSGWKHEEHEKCVLCEDDEDPA